MEAISAALTHKAKLEVEIEQHVLGTTVKLSDGSTGHVFSRGPKNEAGTYLYHCHLCSVPNLPGERCLQTHIAGRKHQSKLSTKVVDAESFRAPLAPKNRVQMHIAPGEPVPPGFENEVKPIAEIQHTLDRYKEHALVGLEYIIELTMAQAKEPAYVCLLCTKRGDPRTIIIHISSYNHRIKYLEKHYPSVTRALETYRYSRDARNVVVNVIQAVCEAIEDHHGRLTPNVHDNFEYKRNPMKILQEVINDKHFDEKYGPSFVEVIDHEMINKTIRMQPSGSSSKHDPSPPKVGAPLSKRSRSDRKSLDSISSISSSSLSPRSRSPISKSITKGIPEHERYSNRSKSPTTKANLAGISRGGFSSQNAYPTPRFPQNSNEQLRPHEIKFNFMDRNQHLRGIPRAALLPPGQSAANRELELKNDKPQKYLPSPKELSQQATEIATERYKWEKFRCLVEIAVTELDKTQKEYEKNPEKHPLYPDEWKKFWNKRYKELQAEKKDPAKHDFKPEWIAFWTNRMKELFDENIEKKKEEIRTKLGLPHESEEKTDQLRKQYKIGSRKSKSPTVRSEDDDCIIQEDSRFPLPIRRPREERAPSKERYSRRSRSPTSYDRKRTSREKIRERSIERYSRERQIRERSISPRGRFSPPPTKLVRHRSPIPEFYREREYYPHIPPTKHRHSPTPHYSESYDEWASRYYGQPHRARPVYGRGMEYKAEDANDKEPLTVVSVLRLLTALEEHLGSLGPKIIDLLAKALALEKVKANSSDELLLIEDNCVIFETVKEKLKGQLIAEVIEPQKISAVKRAVKNIASVIHLVNEQPKSVKDGDQAVKEKIIIATPRPVEPTSDAAVDKAEIAKKVAASLIAQGKTDITNDQLEMLINTYIGMVQTQKDGQQPVSTANYLKEIEHSRSPSESVVAKLPAKDIVEKSTITAELEKSLGRPKPDEKEIDASTALESLTDSDLQTLLQNFKDLSSEEQQHLISYLKKLESSDPERVEKLKKYVNLNDKPPPQRLKPEIDMFEVPDLDYGSKSKYKSSSGSQKMKEDDFDIEPPGINTAPSKIKLGIKMSDYIDDEDDARKFLESDEDDDYTFDDVVKAASKNVKDNYNRKGQRSFEREDDVSQFSNKSYPESTKSSGGFNMSLSDTQNLIANLMGSLQKNTASGMTQQMSLANQPAVAPPIYNQNVISNPMMHQQQQNLQQPSSYNPNNLHYQMPNQLNDQMGMQQNMDNYNLYNQQQFYPQNTNPPAFNYNQMNMDPMQQLPYNDNGNYGEFQQGFNSMVPNMPQMPHPQHQQMLNHNIKIHTQSRNYGNPHQQSSNLTVLGGNMKHLQQNKRF